MDTGTTERTTCLVSGGGPAGMVLGLLLARAGVEVTVLEKHADFLRDFRGDTVHPSTLRLLNELGLGEEFEKLPQSKLSQVSFPDPDGSGSITVGDFGLLPGPYQAIAMVPQWDLLDLLADAGRREPSFTLRMNTEVTDLVYEDNRVAGVRYRTSTGQIGTIRADLTIGCDGRSSLLREAAGLVPHEYPVPLDTWWFRLPKAVGDSTDGLTVRLRGGEMALVLPREGFHQVAFMLQKGADAKLRAAGVASFRKQIASLLPWFADRMDEITTMDDVKMLDVKLNRLRKWYVDGLLCIGDAAHAMSPIGGVGINVAVQDAVATARILAGPLRAGTVRTRDLAKVQAQRWFPTAVVQGLQRVMHAALIGPVLRGERTSYPKVPKFLFSKFPRLRVIPAYIIGIGPRPEHAPKWARRSPVKAGS